MAALIFLVAAVAMMAAMSGRRGTAIGLFCLSLLAAVAWLDHHMTDSLPLAF